MSNTLMNGTGEVDHIGSIDGRMSVLDYRLKEPAYCNPAMVEDSGRIRSLSE